MGAMPASPTTAGLKHVQARAMGIAMENSESVFTFADKISNAQNFHDIVTLRAQFAKTECRPLPRRRRSFTS